MANETTDVLIIGTGFGGSIPGYYLAAGGARVIMLERGPEALDRRFLAKPAGRHLQPHHRQHLGQRHRRHRGQLRRRLERRLLRSVAAGAELRLRASRHARPSDLADVDHPPDARPVVSPRRAGLAGKPAELERRTVCRRRFRGGVYARGTHLPAGAGRRRPHALHQLQLDAYRLHLRREALDAA